MKSPEERLGRRLYNLERKVDKLAVLLERALRKGKSLVIYLREGKP